MSHMNILRPSRLRMTCSSLMENRKYGVFSSLLLAAKSLSATFDSVSLSVCEVFLLESASVDLSGSGLISADKLSAVSGSSACALFWPLPLPVSSDDLALVWLSSRINWRFVFLVGTYTSPSSDCTSRSSTSWSPLPPHFRCFFFSKNQTKSA